jgi:uncharacterized protein (DUF1499 family)
MEKAPKTAKTAKTTKATKVIGALAMLLAVLAAGVLVAGQLGLFAGSRPTDLGVHDGMLKAPGVGARNVVSSQAASQPHNDSNLIAPLHFEGDPNAAFARLQALLRTMDGATIVSSEPGYLHVEFRSRMLHFVDDAEFLLDAKNGVIQMRSASRVGRGDFGVNRARLERIRQAFGGR